jgi:hypothetical protein
MIRARPSGLAVVLPVVTTDFAPFRPAPLHSWTHGGADRRILVAGRWRAVRFEFEMTWIALGEAATPNQGSYPRRCTVELASQELIASLLLHAAHTSPARSSRNSIRLAANWKTELLRARDRDAIAASAGSASTTRAGSASSRRSSPTPNTTPAAACGAHRPWNRCRFGVPAHCRETATAAIVGTEYPGPRPERVRGDPAFIRPREVLAGDRDGRLDALPPSGGVH